jgi:hypothetical protein
VELSTFREQDDTLTFAGDMKQHEFRCILGFGKKAPHPPIPMTHGRFIRQV